MRFRDSEEPWNGPARFEDRRMSVVEYAVGASATGRKQVGADPSAHRKTLHDKNSFNIANSLGL